MTLYEFLMKQKCTYLTAELTTLRTDREKCYENKGRWKACDELINLLSDENLKTEVKTRAEVMKVSCCRQHILLE